MTESEHYVTVHVSTELLAKLREWSQPVQAQIQETPGCATGYEMIFRVYEPTYTASEVKVLTETASKVAYALGRKDAGEEIAEALEALAEAIGVGDQREFLIDFADTARDIASPAFQAASDATSGVPGHPEVSEAVRSPQEPCGHPTCPCTSQEAR